MKTITHKNALKLFLFVLVLLSAKTFSFTALPTDANSRGSESKIGYVKKSAKAQRTSSNAYASTGKTTVLQSKNNKRFKK